ncbi:hypothetical protein [Rubrobacter tropicus]|uniref:hypothetical protein n=1 Tax=Rubrobacter tropicus TaxID=2653851 RepID=UPI00140D3DAB|nr:hypothetical protein [Rubrobacter tropicus]
MLAVIAYVAVPGERRKKAAVHFRRAGFEALKGVAALARPDAAGKGGPEEVRRERIEVE